MTRPAAPTVRTSVPALLWHGTKALFSARVRKATPEELRLAAENDGLRHEVAGLQARVFDLEHDLKVVKSDNLLNEREIKRLTDICERDRLRIEAESSAYGRKIEEDRIAVARQAAQ